MNVTIYGAAHHRYIYGYGGKSYVIWVWKGVYGSYGDGNEIGSHVQNSPVPDPDGWWAADSTDPNLPKMTVSLKDRGSKVVSFAPAKPQPWVAAFHPGSWELQASNLEATDTVTFPNAAMYDAFRQRPDVAFDKGWQFQPGTNTATLNWRQ